ncbi:hypothetical protein [Chryseobacterium sp. JK1]|uniref:hypothetical protein n=1 Tax=Chryseobacterium sp. JK1 TaxID=874294 RepID=UPI003D684EA3
MGRPNKNVFEYDFNGKYLRKWTSENDFRKHYYTEDKGNRPLFVDDIKGIYYHITHNDTIALIERPGRDFILYMLRVHNSELCNFKKNEGYYKPIQMFNLKDELLAEFSSLRIAEYLLKISRVSISNQLKRGDRKTRGLTGDYYFQYKNTDQKPDPENENNV